MQTYLFYDTETTGLNKSFDQVLHFAAIRTDLNLKEIERYEVKAKLNPDLIPHPRAMITHHIGIQESLSGICEFEAIKQIHEWINTPGTISVGYNTLGFDDEFLRFSFYRNLLTPYTHQYANQCSRMDIYPIAAMYYLFKNDVLHWPKIDGATKLKLELINQANQLFEGRSHHAMVDVEVTLALAKRFHQSSEMWDYVLGYFNKQIDQERFQQLPNDIHPRLREGLMIEGVLGSKQNFIAPVLCLGEHIQNKNQTLWLRLDTASLTTCTENSIPENTWVLRKKWAEPGLVLPPKERFLSALNAERREQTEINKAWLKQNPDLLNKIIDYHTRFVFPVVPNTDIEASLYHNGFWSAEETALCKRFHQSAHAEKSLLIESIKNPKLKTLALRIIARNFPETLSPDQQQTYAEYKLQVNPAHETLALIDFKGNKRLNPQEALNEIIELRKTDLDAIQQELLNDLEIYLKDFFPELKK